METLTAPTIDTTIIPLLLQELEAEAPKTRKMLALVPLDKAGWKPHEKSMPMQNLAVHIAELPSWISMALHTNGIDFATMDFTPAEVADNTALLELFEKSLAEGRKALETATDADLSGTWTMRSGEQVHAVMTKYETIRHSFAQTIHHRAQLGVYLRLLNIPIPGTYGPSADDMNF